jgi:hypothetical protein
VVDPGIPVEGLADLAQDLGLGEKASAPAGLTDGPAQLTIDTVESAGLERDYIDTKRETEPSRGNRAVNIRGLLGRL